MEEGHAIFDRPAPGAVTAGAGFAQAGGLCQAGGVDVGILGGTGPAGLGLAARLAAGGLAVVVGSRDEERATAAVAELRARWPDRALAARAGTNAVAAEAALVVVATPWDAAEQTVVGLADALAGKVVVSMANALVGVGREIQAVVPARGSVAAGIAAALPRSRVAAAFHHLPAKELAALDAEMEGDVLVCADEPAARLATAALVARMPRLRALDAGSLAAAAPVESFTAVLLGLNRRYRTRAALTVTGIPGAGMAEVLEKEGGPAGASGRCA